MIDKIIKMLKSVFIRQKPLSFVEMQEQIGKAYFGNYAEFCQMFANNQEKQMLHEHFLQKCLFAMLAKNLDREYPKFIERILLYRLLVGSYPVFAIFINTKERSVENFETAWESLTDLLLFNTDILKRKVTKDIDKEKQKKMYFGVQKIVKSAKQQNEFSKLYAG